MVFSKSFVVKVWGTLFMSIKALRTLRAIIAHGSFSAAGDKIGLTQAAVSTQMKQLETELDTKLFEKIGRNLVLTRDGEKVMQRAEQILSMYDSLGDGLGQNGLYSGELLERIRKTQSTF